MAKPRNFDDLVLSLGIDVSTDNAQENIQVLERVLRQLGEVFNRELELNINTNDLNEIVRKFNDLDVNITSAMNHLHQLSDLAVNFSSGQGKISTYRVTNITEQIQDMQEGYIPRDIEATLSHRQNGSYVLNEVVKQYKEIERLNNQLNKSDVGSEKYRELSNQIQSALDRLYEFALVQNEGAGNLDELVETERRFNHIVEDRNRISEADRFDKEFAGALREEANDQQKALDEVINRYKEILSLNQKRLSLPIDSKEIQYYSEAIDKANEELNDFINSQARWVFRDDELKKAEEGFNRLKKAQEDKAGAKSADKELKEQIKDVEKLTSKYTKFLAEKEKLASEPDSKFSDQLKVTSKTLEETISDLKEYGITVDETNGKIETTFDRTKLGISETSEAYKKLNNIIKEHNETIERNQAKQKDDNRNREVKNLLKDLDDLYKSEKKLQDLKFAKGKSEDIIKQTKRVEELRAKTKGYTKEVQESEAVQRKQSQITRRLAEDYADLNNNLHRTGINFGGFVKKLGESAKNTLQYSLLYKTFEMLDKAVSRSIEKIRELDTMMTEIQMVTGQSDEETRRLLNTYADMAVQLGATTKQVAEGKTLLSLNYLNCWESLRDYILQHKNEINLSVNV